MMITNSVANQERRTEAGNVLFLILIAVALFAALSYAVTQSTRSGGGDAGRETTLVNASTITQYPASVKTAITRMIVTNSIGADELIFDPPSNFTAVEGASAQGDAVFYPTGGGATYSQAPASVMNGSGAGPGTWVFNGENQIADIGTGGALGTTNADIIAFLPNVKQAVCESIHSKLGIVGAIPDLTGDNVDYVTQTVLSNIGIGAGGGTISDPLLDGQPQGCFKDGSTYVYYHVLVER